MFSFHNRIGSDQQVGRSSLHFDKFHNVPKKDQMQMRGGAALDSRAVGQLSGGERSVDEDGMVGWSSSCPLQSTSLENVCIGRGDQ